MDVLHLQAVDEFEELEIAVLLDVAWYREVSEFMRSDPSQMENVVVVHDTPLTINWRFKCGRHCVPVKERTVSRHVQHY